MAVSIQIKRISAMMIGSGAGRTESAAVTRCRVDGGCDKTSANYRHDDELRDAIVWVNDTGFIGKIRQDHFEFAPVIAVNGAGPVEHEKTFPESESGSRPHFGLIAFRNFKRQPGRNQNPTSWRHTDILLQMRVQIGAGGSFGLVFRQTRVRMKKGNLDFDQAYLRLMPRMIMTMAPSAPNKKRPIPI